MTVEQAIVARVAAIGAVQAMVGSRVYLVKLPQSPVYPSVRVFRVDVIEGQHLRGPDGNARARVQIDAYTQQRSGVDPNQQVLNLAAAIHGDGLGPNASGVSGWIGGIGSPPFEILNCRPAGQFGPRFDAEELNTLTLSLDYFVTYRATG